MRTFKEIKTALLAKDFKYVKVEMEAQTNASGYCSYCDGSGTGYCEYCNEGQNECENCRGDGYVDCEECEGRGTIETIEDGNKVVNDCECCDGRGTVTCSDCEGDGRVECGECEGNYEYDCECDGEGYEAVYESFRYLAPKKFLDNVKHIHAYNDGSVDTEITFTIRVDYLWLIPQVLKAFRLACERHGDCEVDNAGMHITIMQGYQYPRKDHLPTIKINNFKTEVGKFITSLYPLASKDGLETRGFSYRRPFIHAEKNGGDGCPAICTHGDTCLEYRIFDTCYDKPMVFRRFMDTIVNTLEYYSSKKYEAKETNFSPSCSLTEAFGDKGIEKLIDDVEMFELDQSKKRGLQHLKSEFCNHIIGKREVLTSLVARK